MSNESLILKKIEILRIFQDNTRFDTMAALGIRKDTYDIRRFYVKELKTKVDMKRSKLYINWNGTPSYTGEQNMGISTLKSFKITYVLFSPNFAKYLQPCR